MCSHPECLEGIQFGPAGSSIQVGYGYIDGRKFSALVRDARYGGTEHLHFPAGDFDAFVRVGSGVPTAPEPPPPDVVEEAIVPLERGSRRFSPLRRDRHDAR
jgi:hypothetical protein